MLLLFTLFYFFVDLKYLYCMDIKLGMISPFSHPIFGFQNNAAAATLAIDKAFEDGIIHGINVTVQWRDDTCSAYGGVSSALQLKEVDKVDVFIGPPCTASATTTGLLAAAWNIPMLSQGSTDPILQDKSVYNTVVRLGPPFNKLGRAFLEVFKYFKWDRVVMIFRRKVDQINVFCDYSSRSIEKIFRENNITLAEWIVIDDGISDDGIDDVLERTKRRGRILIFCTENSTDERRFLIKMVDKGMTDGSYVVFIQHHLPPLDVEKPWIKGDQDDAKVKLAFSCAFQITVAEIGGKRFENFRDLVSEKMALPPWNYNYTYLSGMRGSEYSAFLHDVVYLYLMTVNETLEEGLNYKNGTLLFEKARGKVFKGITGTVKVDSNGDRDPDYWIWDLQPDGDMFEVVLEARMTSQDMQKIYELLPISWNTPDGNPPPDEPICGFSGENCPSSDTNKTTIIICLVLAFVFIICVLAVFSYYKRTKFEKELELQRWKIDYNDIKRTKMKVSGSISQLSLTTGTTGNSTNMTDNSSTSCGTQIFSSVGYIKGEVVAIKNLTNSDIPIDRETQLELKAMRELSHENVNRFVGLCIDERGPSILTVYCTKGSLQDIIANEDIKLHDLFKMSLIRDLANGILYIHNSQLKYHGNLKSSNCVVDNRWVLKVTDFGLKKINHNFRPVPSSHQRYSSMFWTAPEHIPTEDVIISGSQKGDIYSIGIILFEILFRTEPYDTNRFSPEEIIRNVRNSKTRTFRPSVEQFMDEKIQSDDKARKLITLMKQCWTESPDRRPPSSFVYQKVKKLVGHGRKSNIVDHMVQILEKYANNLEELVEVRTAALMEEKKKTDKLLYQMLPRVVADQLKFGNSVRPEVFENVSIYFSDIVGFTELASSCTPMEIIDLLNDLYTGFDATIAFYDVYKVETIGDAYMVVSGLPVRNGFKHAQEIADMSLDLLKFVHNFEVRFKPTYKLQLRIGIHSGSCAAGVVGSTMPRYCLFGDTVNTASRMESTGEALQIHISQQTYDILVKTDLYQLTLRGEIEVKGKGLQRTYWLKRKTDAATNVTNEEAKDFALI